MKLNLSRRNLTDEVADVIRKLILDGKLKPGDKINQAQFAEEFIISRGPIREALRLLENEGLIKHIPNHGTYVSSLSKKDAYEIFSLRAILEEHGAVLALPNLTQEHFNTLENLIEASKAASLSRDLGQLMRLDLTFHALIIKQSNHTRLINMHQHLDTQLGAMYLSIVTDAPNRLQHITRNHKVLVEALKSADSEHIRKAFSAHYLEAFNEVID